MMTTQTPKARADRTPLRACRYCQRGVEDDRQAAALHLLLTCPKATGEASKAARDSLRGMREGAAASSAARAKAGGADARGQELARRQVIAAWNANIGPQAADLLEDE